MSGERTLPGIGLTGFWDLGDDNWKAAMDTNLRNLSALVQCRVASIVSADPGAPADGDIHFCDGDHPTHANSLAVRDNGAWVYLAAFEGLRVYDLDTSIFYLFDGAALVEVGTGGGGGGGGDGIPDAPENGNLYGRKDGAWEIITGGGGGGSTGTPDIRGSGGQSFNNNSVTQAFPAGTAEGDLALVFVEHGYDITTPAGWTVINSGTAGYTFGRTFAKELTAGDIATGSVTVAFGGGYYGAIVVVTLDGDTVGRVVDQVTYNSGGGGSVAAYNASGLFNATPDDLIIGGGMTRGAVTMGVSNVTSLQANNGTSASYKIGNYDMTTFGKLGISSAITLPSGNEGLFVSFIAIRGV